MSTNNTSTNDSRREGFLIDSDVDPELVDLLKKLGFQAENVLQVNVPNDDTQLLIWARQHGYILVCHDKHRDAKTRYSFYGEMRYRGGHVLRISGEPGQPALFALGKILVHRPKWQEEFSQSSGECVVYPSGSTFTPAKTLFERSQPLVKRMLGDEAEKTLRERLRRRRPKKLKQQRAAKRLEGI